MGTLGRRLEYSAKPTLVITCPMENARTCFFRIC